MSNVIIPQNPVLSPSATALLARINWHKEELAFFEQTPRNRTWPMLEASCAADPQHFPTLVYKLATSGLITGRVLKRALGAAWFTGSNTSMLMSQWVELYHLAGPAAE